MVAALQDSQRRRLGADGGVDGEHRRVHGIGVPEGGRRAALHQPSQKLTRLGDRIEAKANPIRYLDPDASLDKDQLLDAVHWIRQAVGLACGLLWGAVLLVGAFWIALWSRRTSNSSKSV
nr:uncharacterized protein LOC109782834 isoform X2 [Aegilops tauschii subsp. strangulata]